MSKGIVPIPEKNSTVDSIRLRHARKNENSRRRNQDSNCIGMKFRLIPPGEFTMGSTKEEIEAALKDPNDKHWQECIKSEAPQHNVILTQPIYLGVNEVTQAEYEKVMGVNPSHFAPMGAGKEAVAGLETTDHPVEMVSWNDAAEFCVKLNQQEKLKPFYFRAGETITLLDGTGYRLPSEAEWEFACRAGTATRYWIGDQDEDLVRAGWFGGNAGGRTHAAGELNANPFGLSDIHGNVWEWGQDGWDATYYRQFPEKPTINPQTPFSASSRRVFRGGSWSNPASNCRSSSRFADAPTSRLNDIGFRLSLVAVGSRVSQALKVTGPAMPKPVANNAAAAANASEKLPATFTNSLGIEFVKVPKGTGWLGGGGGKPGEQKVEFTDDFYLGKYEVTQEEWEKVTGLNPSHFSRTDGGKDAVKDVPDADLKRFPVEMVSWDECQAFAERLNKKLAEPGWVYRLPTAAEREYACRGGPIDLIDSGFNYYFDKPSLTLGNDQANFDWVLKRTCKVGSYQPNALGLFDLHGNVWEWCQDDALPDPNAPSGPSRRAALGGTWNYDSSACKAADRNGAISTSHRYDNVGLRLARVRVSPSPPLSNGTDVPIDFAAERKAAEWVLKVGGTVAGKTASGREFSLNAAPLPAEPFWVTFVSCRGSERVTDDGLKNLSDCRRIEILDLVLCSNLTDKGIRILSPAMPLKKLNASKTNLGDAALEWISQFASIESLLIAEQKWTDRGIAAVARLPNLRSIDVDHSPQVTDATLEALRPATKLEYFNVMNCSNVSAVGLSRFLAAHPALSMILMSSHHNPSPVWLSAVRGHPELREVHISANGLTAESVEDLKTLPNLQKLLVGFGINDAVLRMVASVPRLRTLDLRDYDTKSTATAAGWGELPRLPGLESLVIHRKIPITDECLDKLSEIPTLKSLDLELDADVDHPTTDGIAKFRERRPDVHLKFGGKDYPATAAIDFAAERKAAEWVLKVGGTLSLVDADGKPLAMQGQLLPQTTFSISSVQLQLNNQFSDDDLKNLAACRRLERLVLNSDQINGSGLRHLVSVASLVLLQMDCPALTDEGLVSLPRLHGSLYISSANQLTDDALRHVGKLTKLRILTLRDLPRVTNAGLSHLDDLSELINVGINRIVGVTDEGLTRFFEQHPKLEVVAIGNRLRGEVRTAKPLALLPGMRQISLSPDQLTDEGLATLNAQPSFERLAISGPISDVDARRVVRLTKLKVLLGELVDTDEFSLSRAGVQALATIPELEKITFFHNRAPEQFDDACLLDLASARKLRSITMGRPKGLTDAGIEAFRKARPDVHLQLGDKDYPASK